MKGVKGVEMLLYREGAVRVTNGAEPSPGHRLRLVEVVADVGAKVRSPARRFLAGLQWVIDEAVKRDGGAVVVTWERDDGLLEVDVCQFSHAVELIRTWAKSSGDNDALALAEHMAEALEGDGDGR